MAQTAQSALRSEDLGVLLAQLAIFFYGRPPSLPGIGRRPAVRCSGRQTHRDVAGCGCHQAADSLVGIPANSELEASAPHFSRAADGIVPAAPRSQAQLPGGPGPKPVLLLWLRPWGR